MARVVAFIPDLMFGSRVQADLAAAGHDVELIGRGEVVPARLADADVLVVDLTDELEARARLVEDHAREPDGLTRGSSAPLALRTLGFYSHVDVAARERGERAGFDLIVPRSRMAREGVTLVVRLIGSESTP